MAFCAVVTSTGMGLAIGAALGGANGLGIALMLIAIFAGVGPLTVTTMRRLQDRNRPPGWMLLVVAPSVVRTFADLFGLSARVETAIFFVVGAPLWTWGVVELGFLRGTAGRNRYGDDPLKPATADTFS